MIAGTQGVWSCLELFLALPNLASATPMKKETNITEIMAGITEKVTLHLANPCCHN